MRWGSFFMGIVIGALLITIGYSVWINSTPQMEDKLTAQCTKAFNECVNIFDSKYGATSTLLKKQQVSDASQAGNFLHTWATFIQGRDASDYPISYPATLFAIRITAADGSQNPYAIVCDAQGQLVWTSWGGNVIC